jgi:hypothetical protein
MTDDEARDLVASRRTYRLPSAPTCGAPLTEGGRHYVCDAPPQWGPCSSGTGEDCACCAACRLTCARKHSALVFEAFSADMVIDAYELPGQA